MKLNYNNLSNSKSKPKFKNSKPNPNQNIPINISIKTKSRNPKSRKSKTKSKSKPKSTEIQNQSQIYTNPKLNQNKAQRNPRKGYKSPICGLQASHDSIAKLVAGLVRSQVGSARLRLGQWDGGWVSI